MSENWLVQVTEVWRVPNQQAADIMEEEFRVDPTYTLTKWAKMDVAVKKGGEIVEEYVKITGTKVFNNIKEPDYNVNPRYQ